MMQVESQNSDPLQQEVQIKAECATCDRDWIFNESGKCECRKRF